MFLTGPSAVHATPIVSNVQVVQHSASLASILLSPTSLTTSAMQLVRTPTTTTSLLLHASNVPFLVKHATTSLRQRAYHAFRQPHFLGPFANQHAQIRTMRMEPYASLVYRLA